MTKLRADAALQISAARLGELMTEWLETTEPTSIWQNCTACNHLVNERCTRHNNVMPPPSVVVVGCSDFADNTRPKFIDPDDIPF